MLSLRFLTFEAWGDDTSFDEEGQVTLRHLTFFIERAHLGRVVLAAGQAMYTKAADAPLDLCLQSGTERRLNESLKRVFGMPLRISAIRGIGPPPFLYSMGNEITAGAAFAGRGGLHLRARRRGKECC
jgi:hypothetical protein